MPEKLDPVKGFVISVGPCSICLSRLPPGYRDSPGDILANLLSDLGEGQRRHTHGCKLGLLHPSFRFRHTDRPEESSLFLCRSCKIGIFGPGYVSLTLPVPLLRYVLDYLKQTHPEARKPLYEVFTLLKQGQTTELPDPTHILPYLGLYSLILPDGGERQPMELVTPFLPGRVILRKGQFTPAPEVTPDNDPRMARIFDPAAVGQIQRLRHQIGIIPLYKQDPEFDCNRYWRLPLDPGVVLVGLMSPYYTFRDCLEGKLAKAIEDLLKLPVS